MSRSAFAHTNFGADVIERHHIDIQGVVKPIAIVSATAVPNDRPLQQDRPMELSSGSSWLSLEPVRYQFAEVSGDSWDDNWLMVRGSVRLAAGSWSFIDPSLTTFEARTLGDWLRRLPELAVDSTANPTTPDLEFTEPNLSFAARRSLSGSTRLRVFLSAEALGNRESEPNSGQPVTVCDFEFSDQDLRILVSSWDDALVNLPDRS